MPKSQQPQRSPVERNKPEAANSILKTELQPEHYPAIIQQARARPELLSPQHLVVLQRTLGNRIVQRLLQPESEALKLVARLEGAEPQLQRACECGGGCPKCRQKQAEEELSPEMGAITIQNGSNGLWIQRALSSPRFAGDTTLENIHDGTGTLKNGDENDSVRKVQHGIHDAGILFLGHGMDGKFGNETERRVARFQSRNRIATDPSGEVGAATIDKLDDLFPATALPTSATDPYTFAGMLELLCQWNSAMIRDLRNLRVEMVGGLEWADEEFDGSTWVPKPMPGAGETAGSSITIATNDTNEAVARTLYHEYQHARQPVAYRSKSWSEEESRAFELETYWAIDRGITPDPGLTTTDPSTGATEIDPGGITSTVESYPGLDATNPGEVIAKVGTNRVRVRMPDGRVTVRNAVAGDSVPGPRRITPPRHVVQDREWVC